MHEFYSSLSNVTLCISYIVYFLSNNLAFHFSEGHNNTCTMKYITLMDKEISTLMRLNQIICLKHLKHELFWTPIWYSYMLLWESCHLRHHLKSNYYFIYSTDNLLTIAQEENLQFSFYWIMTEIRLLATFQQLKCHDWQAHFSDNSVNLHCRYSRLSIIIQ